MVSFIGLGVVNRSEWMNRYLKYGGKESLWNLGFLVLIEFYEMFITSSKFYTINSFLRWSLSVKVLILHKLVYSS